MTKPFGVGCFPSVALGAGQGWLTFREGDPRGPGAVVVYTWPRSDLSQAREFKRISFLAGGTPAFPMIAVVEGTVWFAHHDGKLGWLYNLSKPDSKPDVLEPCAGNFPICFGEHWVAWRGAHPEGRISRMALWNGEIVSAGTAPATGLSHITADGTVITRDENQGSVPGILHPVRAGQLIVGEDPDPLNTGNLGVLWQYAERRMRLWPNEDGLNPRCALDSGILVVLPTAGHPLAVTKWGAHSLVQVFCGTYDELVAASVHIRLEPHPMIPRELENQLALVTEVRNTLFPDKIGQPLNDPRKAMLLTYQVAWRLRHLGVGLVEAKPGSENNVDGYTSDIVALKTGAHWDIQIDGHTGAAMPAWSLVPQINDEGGDNWAAVKPRWTPAVTPPVGPTNPVEPSTHKYDGGGNDTGTCDRTDCGKSRFDPVHKIKEGLVPHAIDLGEDGKGPYCDTCNEFADPDLPLHRVNTPAERHKPEIPPGGTFCTKCGKRGDDALVHIIAPQPGGGVSEVRVREIVREMIGQARISL